MRFIKEKISKVRKMDRDKDDVSFKRIYLIGKELLISKFTKGIKYSYKVDFDKKTVKIVPYVLQDSDGTGTVSGKKLDGNTFLPVVDINNGTIASVFKGINSCKITIFDEEILVEAELSGANTFESSAIKTSGGKVINIGTIKKQKKAKFLLPKSSLNLFLKKAVGSNYEQLGIFDSGFTFSDDKYTQESLKVLKENENTLKDISKVLKYFELFAGTGAGGMAFDDCGFQNVGYSEIDPFAIKNYEANFPGRKNYGDITNINTDELPDFDALIGGSPCTDICIMKKDRDGLTGEKSCLFFDYIDILNNKKPRWFIFENVRNLLTSNGGEDFKIVKKCMEENYNIKYKVLNTSDYGVPETRRRLYIVGQLKELGEFYFEFPEPSGCSLTVQDFLENMVDDKYYLTEKMAETVLSRGTGGWDANPETDLKVARPLTATMAKMHRASQDNYYHTEYKPEGKTNLRRPTPRECARLQGFPDDYKIVVSDSQAYKLFGNAMSLNVVKKVVYALVESIKIPASLRRNLLLASF